MVDSGDLLSEVPVRLQFINPLLFILLQQAEWRGSVRGNSVQKKVQEYAKCGV